MNDFLTVWFSGMIVATIPAIFAYDFERGTETRVFAAVVLWPLWALFALFDGVTKLYFDMFSRR